MVGETKLRTAPCGLRKTRSLRRMKWCTADRDRAAGASPYMIAGRQTPLKSTGPPPIEKRPW